METTEEKLIFAGKNTLSSLSDAEGEYPVAVIAAQGRVLALGDFTFMTNPFYKILDNQQLVQNIAHFLANERRPRTIKDFPYLFDRQAGLWMEKDSLLTQEKLERFSLLQASLGENKIPLSLVEKPIKEYDFLIAEKFNQYQALEDFLEPFDLKFENISTNEEEAGNESSPLPEPAPTLETPTPAGSEETGAETAPEPLDGGSEENFFPFSKENETEDQNSGRIIVPGLGTLSTNGIGLILFDQQENRNTLILLANNNEALSDLTGYFISGSLSNCAFYQDLAVCSVTKDPAGGNSGSTEEYGFADTIY
ncbi:MAG: hypothetical protein IT308_01485 [Anaerolineaceae bacterium]|nr:hypothetical protein [Anaerolineaceae bacterium]